MSKYIEKEITKEEFKRLYFKYKHCDLIYWKDFYENETNMKYFLAGVENLKSNRMIITSEANIHRVSFLSEKSEDSFFDFPTKN